MLCSHTCVARKYALNIRWLYYRQHSLVLTRLLLKQRHKSDITVSALNTPAESYFLCIFDHQTVLFMLEVSQRDTASQRVRLAVLHKAPPTFSSPCRFVLNRRFPLCCPTSPHGDGFLLVCLLYDRPQSPSSPHRQNLTSILGVTWETVSTVFLLVSSMIFFFYKNFVIIFL